jgi:hypothetical protein
VAADYEFLPNHSSHAVFCECQSETGSINFARKYGRGRFVTIGSQNVTPRVPGLGLTDAVTANFSFPAKVFLKSIPVVKALSGSQQPKMSDCWIFIKVAVLTRPTTVPRVIPSTHSHRAHLWQAP